MSDPWGVFSDKEAVAAFVLTLGILVGAWLMGRWLKFDMKTWFVTWAATFLIFMVAHLMGKAFAVRIVILSLVGLFSTGFILMRKRV